HPVQAAGEPAGLRDRAGDPGGQGDLVGEVQGGVLGPQVREALQQGDQREPGLQGGQHAGHGLGGGAAAALDLQGDPGQVVVDPGEVLGEVGGGDQVIGERGGERDQGGGEGGRGGVQVQAVVPGLDQGVGQLPRGGGGHHGQLGVHAHGQGVLAHQVQGEAVVGVDQGSLSHQLVLTALEAGRQGQSLGAQGGGQHRQPRGDPVAELVRGLAG